MDQFVYCTISFKPSLKHSFPRTCARMVATAMGEKLCDHACLVRNFTIPIEVHNVINFRTTTVILIKW